MQYRCEYTYAKPYGRYPVHTWTLVTGAGGMHLHIHDGGDEHKTADRYSGGFELHFRSPPPHKASHCPDDNSCWLLKCPCWHE